MTKSESSFFEEENFIFKIKKSDIQKIFSGSNNINIKIHADPLKKCSCEILTSRELEVLRELAQGKTNEEIARDLIVSKNTIKAHVAKILQKLDVNDRLKAVMKAIVEKIIEIDYK